MHFEKEIEISMILIDFLYSIPFLRDYCPPGFDNTTRKRCVISLHFPTLPFNFQLLVCRYSHLNSHLNLDCVFCIEFDFFATKYNIQQLIAKLLLSYSCYSLSHVLLR